MIVMVIGGRDFDNREIVHKALTAADYKRGFDLVVPTAYETTQEHVREWCQNAAIMHAKIKPTNENHKLTMQDRFVFNPDVLISFGTDKFTQPIVDYARSIGVLVWEPKP